MYKIYIGEVPILLVSEEEAGQYITGNIQDLVVDHVPKHRKRLHQCIDNLEKGTPGINSIIIISEDLEQLHEDFFTIFKIHKAGGGVVFNEQDEVLAIHRMGYWDLPKGKQDEGETMEATALREVQEETGVEHLELGDFICNTYHTYRSRSNKRILKWTAWYKMKTTDTELTPQEEEDIDLAVWVDLEALKAKTPIYNNILEVLDKV